MVGALSFIIALLLILLILFFGAVMRAQNTALDAVLDSHADCLAQVSVQTSDIHAAMILRQAAHDLDSVEAKARIKELITHEWKGGGPSVPALFLIDLADKIEKGQTEQ